MKKVLISTFTMDVGGLENFLMNIVKNKLKTGKYFLELLCTML